MRHDYIARLVDLTDAERLAPRNLSVEEARVRLATGDPAAVRELEGPFALVARRDERVFLARSLDRPLRYFLAKEVEGPMLVVAESMREISDFLAAEGYADQFHPSYTRMAPAHHLTTIRLVGCPDPNPVHRRFLEPAAPDELLPADLDLIGERYVGALRRQVEGWLDAVPSREPIGVLFSGGLDSGSVLLAVYRALLDRGESPARLKAFTLAVDGGGEDLAQAREFLRRLDLEMLGEAIEVEADAVDPYAAIELIEDYKPLDVECAAVNLALLTALRDRYPDWRHLIDGDGGDENLKDYPIGEGANDELTIVSVVNNPLLYQEGWGVDCIKHSLTYSGGFSRGCVRTYAPARALGFHGFSPFATPPLVAVATAIPFSELAGGEEERLYALKGEILARGVVRVLDLELPVFDKRRFQRGAVPGHVFAEKFGVAPEDYRRHFDSRF